MPELGSGQSQEAENTQVTDTVARELHNFAEPEASSIPKNTDKAESTKSNASKKPKGGSRRGADRKPNLAKRLLSGVKPVTAAEALAGIDVQAIVHDLLKNGSRPVKLQTLTVLWDRIFGKPKQDVSVSGGLLHTHTRDPFLATLPKEALEALARSYDEVLAKYGSNTSQDCSHNQTQSKPAMIAEQVESEAMETEKSA